MAKKQPLKIDDLGATPDDVKASSLHDSFDEEWNRAKQKPTKAYSLFRTVMRVVGWGKANCVVTIYTLSSLIKLVPSLLLSTLIDDFENDTLSAAMRYLYAFGLFIIPVICWMMWMYAESRAIRMGGKVRAMVSDAIYRKALRLSSVSRCSTSSGELMNLMSSDAYLMLWTVFFYMALIALPILVVVIFIYVYMSMGVTALIIIVMFLLMLGLMCVGVYRYAKERLKCLKSTDERVKLVSDVTTGIRVVKFYCWEQPFRELIDKSRKSEIVFVRRIANVLALYFDSVTFIFPKLMPLAGFALYPVITGTPLTSAIAFSIISLYKIIESSIFYIPWILASCAQLQASS